MIKDEVIIEQLILDLLNKKITINGESGTKLTLKCSTINEFIDLKEKCSKLLKTQNFVYR